MCFFQHTEGQQIGLPSESILRLSHLLFWNREIHWYAIRGAERLLIIWILRIHRRRHRCPISCVLFTIVFDKLRKGWQIFILLRQNDLFPTPYLETVLKAADQKNTPIIIFADYFEDRSGEKVDSNRLLFIKRCLNFPLRFSLYPVRHQLVGAINKRSIQRR